MIRLKSNQLAYKLFLALCIIGSGVNVHGVDSSTGDVKTVVMQDPANVGEANAMFEEAVRLNQLSRVQNLLRKDRTVKPTQFTVERRFIAAASSGKSEIVQYLLNIEDDRKLTLSNVLEALGKAKNVAVRDILFNDERINPQALEPLVQEFVMANNPSHSMVRGLEKLFAGPNEPPPV